MKSPAETLAEEGLTLVDESGAPLVMAAEETAEALAAGDVWFMVGTTTYTFTMDDCDPGPLVNDCNEPIQWAIDYIEANATIPTDGLIHMDGTATFLDQGVVFDGIYANVNKLKGLVGTINPNTLQPNVTLSGSSHIEVTEMISGLGFLLSGFNIQSTGGDGINIHDSSGPLRLIDLDITGTTNTALYIEKQDGTIEMNRVNVHDNSNTGAQIMNYEVMDDTYNTGAITISNSSFDRNAGVTQYGGLAITTGGSVTLQGITVSDNLYGLHVIHSGKVTIKNSVINGNTAPGTAGMWLAGQTDEPLGGDILLDNVVVNDNPYGLKIHTYGNITANKVIATGNTGFGGFFDTCGSDSTSCHPYYYGKVTITNSTFDDNGGPEMLRIWSRGAVVLTNVSASGNLTGAGAVVHTQHSLLVSPVTITGGTFNDNATYGLEVLSKGTITLSKVKASGNISSYGATLDNSSGTTAGVTVKGTLIGDNAFDENGGEGLYVRTNGAVTLSYLSASGNANRGLEVNNTTGTGKVTISKASLDGNVLNGLMVRTNGAITLTTVSASSNAGQGANLANDTGTAGVTISGSAFDHNQGTGLYVHSNGAITLKTTNAVDNSVRSMAFPTSLVYAVHDVFNLDGTPDQWTVEVDAGMTGISYNVLLTSETACSLSYSGPGTGGSEDCAYVGGYYEAQLFPVIFDAEGTWTFTLSQLYEDFEQVNYSFSTDIFDMTGDSWYAFAGADLNNTTGTTAGVTVTGAAFPKYDWGEDIPIRDFTGNGGIRLTHHHQRHHHGEQRAGL